MGVVARSISLGENDTDAIDLSSFDAVGAFSITGVVQDVAGKPLPNVEIAITRNDVIHATTITDARGAFAFAPQVAGVYSLAAPNGAASAQVSPSHPQAVVAIITANTQMRYVLTSTRLLSVEDAGNRHMIYGKVVDAQGKGINGIALEMRWKNASPGTDFPRTSTGRDPFKPQGYYEFLTTKGEFSVAITQGDYESDIAQGLTTVDLPGYQNKPVTYEVNFQLRPSTTDPTGALPTPQVSAIYGRVLDARNAPAANLVVVLLKDGKGSASTVSDDEGRYQFRGLTSGIYALAIAGEILASDLVLDGSNSLARDLRFGVTEAPSTKNFARYYLLRAANSTLLPTMVHLLAPWLAAQEPGVVGFNPTEASRASAVTLLGDGVANADIDALRAADCEIIDRRQSLLAMAEMVAEGM